MTEVNQPFQDPRVPLEERVSDLVSKLTLEEKLESMMQYQPAIERLGVKPYKHGTEAAHGVAWLGEATSFPQSIGLSTTWDKALLKRVGEVIGDEARIFYQRNPAVNGLTLWAPTVDMERDPRWGRTEEAYGEDPLLAGELAGSLGKGIQGDHPFYYKAVATLKHFLGNNNEVDRGKCSASIDPRNMKEYYQEPFKHIFLQGGAKSMMTSYNAINGTPAILHEDVVRVVKGEWGMDGFIVSDAADLVGLVRDHEYFTTYKDAVAYAVKAGIDSITDDKEICIPALREALQEGLLAEADIDRALQNSFRVRFRLGEFDPEELQPYAHISESRLMSPEHQALSLEAARESVVLLKNESGALPLDKTKLNQVAVIGPLADVVFRDWYSGTFPYKVTPLQGIRTKLEGKKVVYASGNDRIKLKEANSGRPVVIREEDGRLISAHAADAGDVFVWNDWGFGSSTLYAEHAGKFVTNTDDGQLAASADEAFGWFVKEVLHLEPQGEGKIRLTTWNGRPIIATDDNTPLMVTEQDDSHLPGTFTVDTVTYGLEEAIKAAKSSETAIVFVGNNPLINGKEEIDRADITLAESQERLIREVYKANPNTVVVVVGSYPFALNWADEHVPAILYMAHGGQETGQALSDVLFGDYSPAGRLSMTWYRSVEELTGIMDYDIIRGKRTYMYYDGKPLYPFGHGLTYASFEYRELEISPAAVDAAGEAVLRVRLANTGTVPGDEVVQVYARVESSRVKRPLRKLAGFERVRLQPGEERIVEFKVPASALAIWDVTQDRFCVESGSCTFLVGRSSSDIRLRQTVDVLGETIPPRSLLTLTRAANFDDCSRIYLDESKEGGTCIRPTESKGWILFTDTGWSGIPNAFEARTSGGSEGGDIEIRLAGPEGKLLGICRAEAGSSEGEASWETVRCSLEASGLDLEQEKDICLCLKGTVGISEFRFIV